MAETKGENTGKPNAGAGNKKKENTGKPKAGAGNEKKENFKKPEEFRVRGEIISVDELPEGKGILLGIFDVDSNKEITVITSEGQLEKFSRNGESYNNLIKPKEQISMIVEQHIENVTGYTDADGVAKKHTSTGLALRTMQNLSVFETITLNAELAANVKYVVRRKNMVKDVESLTEALRPLYSDPEQLKEAVAKALVGSVA